MKKSLLLIFAASIGLAACNNFEKGPSGTLYKIHKDGGKEKIKEGDFVKFDVVQYDDKDSLMYSSYDVSQPIVFQVPKRTYPGDMNDVLTFFGEGDSASFKLDIDSMATKGGQPRPPELKGKYIVFTVKIDKVLHKNANEVDSMYKKRVGDFFQKDYEAAIQKLKNSETTKIKNFIEESSLKPTTSASGLQYVITTAGTGAKPVMGDTVMANYTGRFTNKKTNGKENIFDTSVAEKAKEAGSFRPTQQYGPRPLVVGEMVPGMNEGLMMLGKGGKATFIMPSKLGWGENGARPVIGPYAPVVFEVEVIDVKKPSQLAPPPPPVAMPATK